MKAKGLLSLLAFSEKRRVILLMLQEEPKTLREINDYFKATSPEMIPQIRKLENGNLISQEGKKYVLTEIGEIVSQSFNQLSQTLKIFESNMRFWKEHSISGIPPEFQMRLYELGEYNILEGTLTEIFKPHEEYIKNLLKSERVRGVSPILHPEYPKVVTMLAERGVDISIVVPREIFEKLQKEHKKELQEYLSYGNASMRTSDEQIKIACTTSDTFLSMRLFLKDNTYDFYKNIISYEISALKLGEDLFNYYEKRSEKIELQDI
ncbi:MAG: winged helix-turn-helix domain-containing protein [Candidatus Methanoperedens sp.]|nr:winged helix-turn-helix domain-containing protein [Candidatus Methanoperedens sp.]